MNGVLYAAEYFRCLLSDGTVFYIIADLFDLFRDRFFRFRERSRDGLFDCLKFFFDVACLFLIHHLTLWQRNPERGRVEKRAAA